MKLSKLQRRDRQEFITRITRKVFDRGCAVVSIRHNGNVKIDDILKVLGNAYACTVRSEDDKAIHYLVAKRVEC